MSTKLNESIKAYNVTTHRHTPEIEEQLSYASGKKVILNSFLTASLLISQSP